MNKKVFGWCMKTQIQDTLNTQDELQNWGWNNQKAFYGIAEINVTSSSSRNYTASFTSSTTQHNSHILHNSLSTLSMPINNLSAASNFLDNDINSTLKSTPIDVTNTSIIPIPLIPEYKFQKYNQGATLQNVLSGSGVTFDSVQDTMDKLEDVLMAQNETVEALTTEN
ncbi:8487_t:CDS:2 [Ambispora leptoticha]|uniref:8487_t:CDS:1 n=1 Tax=Ambispora leptoticha TaxID=144679 RepID=A0A9N9BCG1_9GLOM|nr:8487_t:CDS:2 [Ambispora leptoticha]